MTTIYLSPHLDDVALSCGGLVWQQIQAGEQVVIWTICAGDPPVGKLSFYAASMHARWNIGQNAASHRRDEDERSCDILGASFRHLTLPDAIYRRHPDTDKPLYDSDGKLFGKLADIEADLVAELHQQLENELPLHSHLICPLAVGRHVDQQLARAAAEGLIQHIAYYADYPYIISHPEQVDLLLTEGWKKRINPISSEALSIWQQAVAAHTSQISTFWQDEFAMFVAIEKYSQQQGGIATWHID